MSKWIVLELLQFDVFFEAVLETFIDCWMDYLTILCWISTRFANMSLQDFRADMMLRICAVIPPPIRYPIEDTQVKLSANDPPLHDRPVPATDFVVPVECTGDMLMVWDFCCLFGKTLLLSPFLLEDFEKSLDYREGEAPLLLEMIHSLLRAALTDPTLRDEFQQKRKKRVEVTMAKWKDDLCDFLELPSQQGVSSNVISMIRKGYFKQVKVSEKVNIVQTLVNNCLNSGIIRNQIDENIAEYQLIVAQKREIEALEVKQRKEEKELLKQQRAEQANGRGVENGEQVEQRLENGEGGMSCELIFFFKV